MHSVAAPSAWDRSLSARVSCCSSGGRSVRSRLPATPATPSRIATDPDRSIHDCLSEHRGDPAVDHTLTTTAFTLDGYRITRNLGVVRGIMVRSRSIFGTIGGSLQTLVGGNISLFTSLCENTRNEAFELMVAHAQQLGANAVVGIRYDATEVMSGVTEVLCYGTAVVVERSA